MNVTPKHRAGRVITIVTVAVTLAVALWIMGTQKGVVPEYDFGAGAYYYADIPDYENIVKDNVYTTKTPYWVHVVLFLGWGALMYALWKWIDRKG